MSQSTSSFYNQSTFDIEDQLAISFVVTDSDDDDNGTSFDPLLNDIPILAILGDLLDEGESSHGGSIPGRKYVTRDRQAAHHRLWVDYFAQYPRFDDVLFRRRFRMRRELFNRILHEVTIANPFFEQKRDCTYRLGLTPLVKMTSAIRMLTYACPADTLDEWLKIAESTVFECLLEFCETIIALYSEEYTRKPNEQDVARLLIKGEERGFPGMLGSLDCMHWTWKNCPSAWKGQHTGHTHESTLILEVVADHELWIWHAFFGMAGSHNDLNVLENSHLFDELMTGAALPCNYIVNGVQYNMGYYLADGIYPEWATLIQCFRKDKRLNEMEKFFVKRQESCRKDVERTFALLQGKFAMVKQPARIWDRGQLGKIMMTCIILHNMIIQDERGLDLPKWQPPRSEKRTPQVILSNEDYIEDIVARTKAIRSRVQNAVLKYDLVVHQWNHFGSR